MQNEYSPENPFCVIGARPSSTCHRTWLPTPEAARLHAEGLLKKGYRNAGVEFYVVTPLMLVREASQTECIPLQAVTITPPKKERRRG